MRKKENNRRVLAPFQEYTLKRRSLWDGNAKKWERRRGLGSAYHRRLARVYRFLVSPGQHVLEIGCGMGELLAEVKPLVGVGVDFSPEMVKRARRLHPELSFMQADAHDCSGLKGTFDVIILSDLVNDLWDVQTVLSGLRRLCHARTRIILNLYSQVWQPLLSLARKLGPANSLREQNWLTVDDMKNLLNLAGFEGVIRHWPEVQARRHFVFAVSPSNGFCTSISKPDTEHHQHKPPAAPREIAQVEEI